MLIEEYELVEKQVNEANPQNQREQDKIPATMREHPSLCFGVFDEIVEENKSGEEAVSSKSVEAAEDYYSRDPVIPGECDPLIY